MREYAPLVKRSASKASAPAEAAQDADLILYCLADDIAFESVVFGAQGILAGIHTGQITINIAAQMPTLGLHEAAAYKAKGTHFLDASVFGSKNEAANAGLWIVVGGERRIFERVKPVLVHLSDTAHYTGGNGKGTSMQLVGNLIVASQLHALGEAMILAIKAGLTPHDVLDMLHVTDFKSPIFNDAGTMLVERNSETHFAPKWMLKDANLIARFAEQLRAPTPASAVTREMIKAAVNQAGAKKTPWRSLRH